MHQDSPAVKKIQNESFFRSLNLRSVKFCDDSEVVSCEAMQGWWNQGVHEKFTRAYCFLVRCIPDRSSLIPVSSRQAFFFSRPRDTPTTFTGYLNVTKYFEIIDTELSAYEKYWILDEWNYHDAL